MLAVFDIAKELRRASVSRVHVACYTYGAPRVGNSAFAKEYDQLVADSWSVINDQAGLLLCTLSTMQSIHACTSPSVAGFVL